MPVSNNLLPRVFGLVLLLAGAGGCTLYQPLLATLPAVRQQGQVTAAGNWQIPYGGQASVILSPLPHTLAFATGGLHAYNTKRDSSNAYTRARQYEAGIGGYATVGQVWMSAAVGAGQGRSYHYGPFGSVDLVNFGGTATTGGNGSGRRPRIPELLGYYNTRFTQFTTWWPGLNHQSREWGASLRLSQVQFTGLSLNDIAQPLAAQHYLQTSMVMQQHLWRQFKWQATATYDLALDSVTDTDIFARAPLRVGIGIAFCPAKAQ